MGAEFSVEHSATADPVNKSHSEEDGFCGHSVIVGLGLPILAKQGWAWIGL